MKRLPFLLVLAALLAPAARAVQLDATAFDRRVPITVSGYTGASPLTNFPVLVKLAADAPTGFVYGDCAENGADLRFADGTGSLVPHEIESWNPSGDSFIWVQVPMLSGTTTSLSLYYGADPTGLPAVDPTNVWTRYAAVFHGGATIADAKGVATVTAGSVTGADSGGMAGGLMTKGSVTGLQYSNPVTSGALSDIGAFSISGWFKRSNSGTSGNAKTAVVASNKGKDEWSANNGFTALVEGGSYFSVGVGAHQGTAGKGALQQEIWGCLAFSYNKSTTTLESYFNGNNIYSTPSAKAIADPGKANWSFGGFFDGNKNCFQGDMDELRVLNGTASADWIKAEYDSVNAPASFAALSPVESNDADLPRFGNLSASDANGVATFAVPLATPGYRGAVPTFVSVFYGTNGVDWTELALGSTNAVGTLAGTASGLTGNVRYLWYAVASATQDGATKTAASAQRSFIANTVEPTGTYMSFTATVDWDGDPVENVPVLLRLSETAINGFRYSGVTASRFEMLDSDGHLLPYEIDTWNTDGESLVWVLVRDYRDGATFTVRYGAPFSNAPATAEEVWAGYKGVWHMNAASPVDVSLSGNNGTAIGSPVVAAGAIGSALSFPTTGDYVTCGTALPNSELASGFTVEGWANPATVSGTHALFGKKQFISVRLEDSKIMVTTPAVKDHDSFSIGVSAGTWFHWAMTFVPGSGGLRFYVDGTLVNTQLGQNIKDMVNATEMWLGHNEWNGQEYRGLLDEMRLSAGIRSENEIAAEYHAMADDGALSFSSVASSDTDIPVIGSFFAADGNGAATFSVELQRPGCGGAAPTYVSVLYGTNGVDWTELSLGSTNEVGTLTGSVSGLTAGVRYVWYAVATATQDGTPRTTTSPRQSFVARAFDPAGNYKSFAATVVWDGAPAEGVPFLLRISESGINGFDYGDVTASGFEILDDGGQLLPHEIDTWNTNGESLVWTRLPVYRDGATVTVRYGAPFANAPLPATAVWSDYIGVWHLNDLDASASAYGSYSNSTGTAGIDGEKAQASVADEAGFLGKSVKICDANPQGTGYKLGGVFVPDSGTASPLDLGDTFVVSGWFKHKDQDYFWDKLFGKRKGTNNSDEPTGAFAIEIGNSGSADNVNALGGGTSAYLYKQGLKSTLRGVWSHLAFVYDGSNLSIYQDGVLCKSGSINPATDNDAPLCFGNLTDGYGDGTGDAAWCGWIDEVRLVDATPSAEWIAAEYHAMADGGAVSFSSVSSSDSSTPVLGVPSVARNADGSFAVSVAVSENAPASIVCTVGGATYAMTTADASLPATYSATVSGLAPGTHVASVRAAATSGTSVSATCPDAFHAGALAIDTISDADEGMLAPGVFRVSRADADSTGLPALTFDVAFSGTGLAAIADPGISTATIPAGAAYVDIAVTPVPADEVNEDANLVLTVSGALVGQSSTESLTVVNAGFDLAVRYVATTGDDANPGGTPESPKKTIAAAVAAVSPIAPTRTCIVHVAPGLYPIASPIVVTNAVRILGGDPDPSRVVVSNTFAVNWDNQNKRVFSLDHASALVANLTMQKGQYYYGAHGGNLFIGSAGGTVSNCVVEAGGSSNNAQAAGAYLEGGLVTHSIFRKNKSSSGTAHWDGKWKGVLYMKGSSRVENSLFVDNPQTVPVVLIGLAGSSVMRNCTIVDTGLASTNEYCNVFAAINVESQGATVQNVVVAGVTNTIDGATCRIIGHADRFLDGAFDGDASALPVGTVVGTAASFFRNYAASDYKVKYQPKSGGPLYDKGADYSPLPLYDLSGERKRKIGSHVDIGCYEGNGAATVVIVK